MAKEASDVSLGFEVSKGFVGKVLQAVVGFAGTIVFARILGPTDFGGFYLLLALVELALRPIKGWEGALMKRFSETDTDRERIVGFLLAVEVAVVAVMVVGVLLGGRLLVSYTGLDDAPVVFAVLFVAISLFSPFQTLIGATGRVARQTWLDTLRSLVTTPLQLAFVLLGFGAAGMGYGLAGATLLVVPITLYTVRTPPKLPDLETARSLWAFAKYSIVSRFVGKTYDRFDIVLIGFLLGAGTAGQYEVAAKITIPATFVSGLASATLLAKVSNLRSMGANVTHDVTNTVAFASIVAIPLFFGALALDEVVVVTLYGGEYRPAGVLLVGLALYRVVGTQTQTYAKVLDGLDRPDVKLGVNTVTLALNVVLGVFLAIEFGAVGVVAATVVAETLRYAGMFRYVDKFTDGLDLLPRPLVEQAGAGIVMFAVVWALARVVRIPSWPHLVVVVGFGAAVYFGLLLTVSSQVRLTVRSVATDVRDAL